VLHRYLSPFNFNGLVRHYFLRTGSNQADIQVNFVGKDERKAQSHDIAKRIRPGVQMIGGQVEGQGEGGGDPAGPSRAEYPRSPRSMVLISRAKSK